MKKWERVVQFVRDELEIHYGCIERDGNAEVLNGCMLHVDLAKRLDDWERDVAA